MLNSYKFDQEYRPSRKRSVYEQEHKMLHELLASKHQNIQFEYSNPRDALRATVSIRRYIKENKQRLIAMQRAELVIVVRKDIDG